MAYGKLFNPETREAFTVSPKVVYSPILLLFAIAANRVDPDTAMPAGLRSPATKEAFTVAPDVVYSPIALPL
jgi:hypothetical protein